MSPLPVKPASSLAKTLRRAAAAAIALAVVLVGAAWIADRTLGRDVLLFAPHDPAVVELNRSLWIEGDPVGPLYGSVASRPVRVLLADENRLLRPVEDPALALLPSGADGVDRPLQARTVWLVARSAAAGLLLAAVAALVAASALATRRGPVAAPEGHR